MLSFLRRRVGRGGLGAAVTAIPSAPAPAAAVLGHTPAGAADAGPAVAVPLPGPPAPVAPVPGPRVELGFRDGTSARLDPTSPAAHALEDLARLLTRGD